MKKKEEEEEKKKNYKKLNSKLIETHPCQSLFMYL